MKIIDGAGNGGGDDKDPPIEPQGYLGGVTVVDFGDLRVARGLSRRPFSGCHHRKLHYDGQERRIWCAECERNIEPFDAFLQMVEQFSAAWGALRQKQKTLDEAMAFNATKRATLVLEKEWRRHKSVPCCPHCTGALFPEDFINGVGTMSRSFAEARRAKQGEHK